MTVNINGTSGISGVDGSAGTPALQGSDSNTGISFGTDEVQLITGGTQRALVDSTGYLRLAGAGIQFNGDTAAANALDDYEEGTWTPEAFLSYNPNSRTITTSESSGRYTKIGRVVHCWFTFTYTISGTSSAFNLGIDNLPFVAASGYSYGGGGVAREGAFTGSMFICENVAGGTDEMNVLRRYDNGSPRDPSGSMSGHVVYEV